MVTFKEVKTVIRKSEECLEFEIAREPWSVDTFCLTSMLCQTSFPWSQSNKSLLNSLNCRCIFLWLGDQCSILQMQSLRDLCYWNNTSLFLYWNHCVIMTHSIWWGILQGVMNLMAKMSAKPWGSSTRDTLRPGALARD